MRTSPALLLAVALLGGCSSQLEYEGAFLVPFAGDITAAGQESPFNEAVAWIASRDGGQIRPLAAESGRFLTDDSAASFLRGSPLPTGQGRTITSLAAWVPGAERATVFVADQSSGLLLEVPHVVGVEEGAPVEAPVSVSEVTASGGGRVTELEVHDGFAATETFTLTWDGAAWRATGSVSGPLGGKVEPGEPYTPESQAFTLTATAGDAVGDTLTFSTDSGLVEHDLGAPVTAVATAPDQSLIAASTRHPEGGSAIVWWDPESASVAAEIALPEGSRPVGLTFAGDTLYVADASAEVDLEGVVLHGTIWKADLGATEAEAVVVEGPVAQLAPALDQDRLYYVLAGETDLRARTLSDGAVVDLDPVRPGSTSFPLHSVVRGMTAVPGTVTQVDDDDDGEPRTAQVLAISLYQGSVVFYDHDVRCLLQDGFGPRTQLVQRQTATNNVDYTWDFDGATTGPELGENGPNPHHVVVSGCAGIARDESWTLTFDDGPLAWRVEGSLSGEQQGLAYEGVRYVSDDGAISFLIYPGLTPSQDGWTMSFDTVDGVLGLTGDQDDDGIIDSIGAGEFPWSLPGPPLPVLLPAAGTRPETPAVIVPLEGNGLVVRGRPDNGGTDAVFE